CAPGGGERDGGREPPSSADSPADTAAPTDARPGTDTSQGASGTGAVCLESGAAFVADGQMSVQASGPDDARLVGGLRREAYAGCERLVIDLHSSEDTPASGTGAVRAEFLRD